MALCAAGVGLSAFAELARREPAVGVTVVPSASNNVSAYNYWSTKRVENMPGWNPSGAATNTQRISYLNFANQPLLVIIKDVTTGNEWKDFYAYDGEGRQILHANNSAINGYSEAEPDLLRVFFDTNGRVSAALYLNANSGLIEGTEYYDQTTATTTTAGGVEGWVESTFVQQGYRGTRIVQSSVNYIANEVDGETFYFTNSTSDYANENGTGAITTTYAREFFSGTNQEKSLTVTENAVAGSHHGSGLATSYYTLFNQLGQAVWTKDAAGYIDYAEYDPATGALIKSIQDADTTETGDFDSGNLQLLQDAQWSSPQGDHAHLTTTYEFDTFGRTTKVTDPSGVVTWTVYNDANHEVRSYYGLRLVDSTWTTTGPISVYRDDPANGYSESLTFAATPAVDVNGRPTGAETISNIQSLSRSYVNEGGQTVETRQYFDLSGLTYSDSPSLGQAGVNYLATTYSYNRRGWLKRTQGPDGVISRTVYDNLGRTVSSWVGTDDTPTSGAWSPTNTAGTDLVMMSELIYDNGQVGDGNLTESRQYVATGQYIATKYAYDWRGRMTDVRGADDVATQYVLGNLGQTTSVQTYADTNHDFNIGSTELRGQTDYYYDELGRVYRTTVRSVDQATGQIGTETLDSYVWFDARGMTAKTTDSSGVFGKTVYDGLGRAVISYVSFDADELPTDQNNYAAAMSIDGDTIVSLSQSVFDADRLSQVLAGTSLNNAVVTAQYYYDDAGDGTGDDTGRLTGVATLRPKSSLDGNASDYVITRYFYNDAGQQNITVSADPDGAGDLLAFKSETTYDMLGRVVSSASYATDGQNDTLLSYSENEFDDTTGRAVASRVYAIEEVNEEMVATDYLETTYDYDDLGRLVKTTGPNGAFSATVYNDYGRVLTTYTATDEDTVVVQTVPHYDSLGRVDLVTSYQRSDGSTKTGDLASGTWSSADSRRTFSASWFDDMGRTKAAASYGTNGGTDLAASWPLSAPTGGSDDAIIARYAYDGFGRNNVVYDNADRATRTFFDSAGRQQYVVENYVDFSPTNIAGTVGGGTNEDQDRVTAYQYNNAGLLTALIAYNVVNSVDEYQNPVRTVSTQNTRYVYEMDLDASVASPVTNGAILRATVYPDAEDASSNPLTVEDVIDILEGTNTTDPHDFVATTYNADGSVHTSTDQRGIVHTYAFDDLGRLLSDSADITAAPTVDDTVLRIERAYDAQGRLAILTSYSDPAGGDANITNQVGWDYDQWGSVVEIWQAHQDDNGSGTAGWIADGTTPSVQYTYADGTDAQDNQAEFVRLASIVYPDGRVIEYAYGTAGGINDRLSRVESITSSGGSVTYAVYSYMGAGTIVGVEYPEVGSSGLTLDYGADGSTGLDRFGRVVNQTWVVDSTEVDDYSYAYDRNSNRSERANGLNSAFSEVYTYDGLNRLIDTSRGGADYQDWTLDAQGNWTAFDDQGTEQDRTTNAANELTTVEGKANPTYDAAGNLTFDGTIHLRYDAWNRLSAVYADDVSDPGEAGDLIVVYQYDGRGLRVARSAARYDGLDPHTVTGYDRSDYLYDESRQVLEERFAANVGSAYTVADTPHVQYLPSLGYADSPILRWRNTDGDLETGDDSGMDEVLYYTTDANHNVTTLLDTAGGVVESYAYDAYGRAEIFSPAPSTGDGWGDGSVVTASAVANEITYASYWFDPDTGLFHTDARDYHPTLGTWTSRDPAGYIDGMSLYGYVGSNPATLTDPTGQCSAKPGRPNALLENTPCSITRVEVKLEPQVDWHAALVTIEVADWLDFILEATNPHSAHQLPVMPGYAHELLEAMSEWNKNAFPQPVVYVHYKGDGGTPYKYVVPGFNVHKNPPDRYPRDARGMPDKEYLGQALSRAIKRAVEDVCPQLKGLEDKRKHDDALLKYYNRELADLLIHVLDLMYPPVKLELEPLPLPIVSIPPSPIDQPIPAPLGPTAAQGAQFFNSPRAVGGQAYGRRADGSELYGQGYSNGTFITYDTAQPGVVQVWHGETSTTRPARAPWPI